MIRTHKHNQTGQYLQHSTVRIPISQWMDRDGYTGSMFIFVCSKLMVNVANLKYQQQPRWRWWWRRQRRWYPNTPNERRYTFSLLFEQNTQLYVVCVLIIHPYPCFCILCRYPHPHYTLYITRYDCCFINGQSRRKMLKRDEMLLFWKMRVIFLLFFVCFFFYLNKTLCISETNWKNHFKM